MVKSGFIDGLYTLSNWILRFMFVNLLWVLFSCLGILIAGFFPSTIAMFTIIRKWVLRETDFPIFKTFWSVYKKEFLKGNLFGLCLNFIGFVLYADLILLQQTGNSFFQFLYIPFLILTFFYLTTFLYVFPVFVHYEIKGLSIIKNAFLLSIINPLSTFKMSIGLLIISYLMIAFPGLIVIFGGSVTSYFIMRIANTGFLKYEQKRANIVNELNRH